MNKVIKIQAGRWYKSCNYFSCCDCGLVHRAEYKVRIKGIELNNLAQKYGGTFDLLYRFWRDEKGTKKERKKLGVEYRITKK